MEVSFQAKQQRPIWFYSSGDEMALYKKSQLVVHCLGCLC